MLSYSQTVGQETTALKQMRGASTVEKDEKINMVNKAFEIKIENMRKKYELHINQIEEQLERKEFEHTAEKERLKSIIKEKIEEPHSDEKEKVEINFNGQSVLSLEQ